jgi:D-amino-acid dehydrogenase
MRDPNVAIVGGGVIGLCAALALRRAGADVTVLERDVCGSGASTGNAGWITPGFSVPLAAPGAARRALRWLFEPAAPVRLRPRTDASFISWSAAFLRNATDERYEAGIRSLLGFNEATFELFDRLRDSGVEFEMHPGGVVFAALEDAGHAEEREVVDRFRALGYPGEIVELSRDELLALEPALSPDVCGGFHARDERHVRPETLVDGLVRALTSAGGVIREHTRVDALRRERDTWRVAIGGDTPAFDNVVLAASVWTDALARSAGVAVPLEGARGYSITVDGFPSIRHALYLAEAKIACTPFPSAARVAGMLDFAGAVAVAPARRVAALRRGVERYLPGWSWEGAGEPWAGLRPLPPDGLPVVGEVPAAPGLIVATGHGMLGVTLAPATAELITRTVFGPTVDERARAFSPARFSR